MTKIKTYRLNCTIMAGKELYHLNSLHVEGKMVPDMELEFRENPQYFDEHSYVEIPDPEPVVKKEVSKAVKKKEVEKPVFKKEVKKVLKKKKLILKKKKKVVKEK